MKSIYKYKLTTTPDLVGGDSLYTVEMPIGATVLKVAVQRDDVCLWALVDPDNSKEERTFFSLGTGWPIDERELEGAVYLDTLIVWDGAFVYHFFEDTRVFVPVEKVEPVPEKIMEEVA